MPALEQLGVVTAPSGVLIVIDTGLLKLWSHDRTPAIPEGVFVDEAATATANSLVDLRLVGTDAERASRMLEMSYPNHLSLYLYDQPRENLKLQSKLDKLVQEQGLDVRFEVIDPRIPHRQRVDLAIKEGQGAGMVHFQSNFDVACGGSRPIRLNSESGVAVSGVPTTLPLQVIGERCEGPNASRWREVIVQCRPDERPAKTQEIGFVTVEYSRILVADLDALGIWKHEKSLDGLADFLFWGPDAERVASAVEAPRSGKAQFGWVDVPVETAERYGTMVKQYRNEHSLRVYGDYYPHSHHWQVMKSVNEGSPTESGTTELDGTTVCNFMTTWGDGFFRVYRDLSEKDELIRIRIEWIGLANPDTDS